MRLRRRVWLTVIALCAVLAIPAYTAPIQGTLNIFGDVEVGLSTIDWLPPQGAGVGDFRVGLSNTGDFAAAPALSVGTEQDLDAAVTPVGPVSIPGYLTLAALPNVVFDLTFIYPGNFSPAACAAIPASGQTCTPPFPPPVSPFNLTNTQTGSTASFSVAGIVTNTLTGELSNFTGVYTTQFNVPFQALLGVVSGGGVVPATYSATFVVTPIPEPSTALLLGLGTGLLGVSSLVRRFRRR